MISNKTIALFAFTLLLIPNSLAWAQQVTVEISGTVTSVDGTLASEFAPGESIVFTVELDATAGWDLFGANAGIDATRFAYSSSNPATFTSGGDYTGSSNSGQLDFYDKYTTGFPNTAEGFRWESNTFTAPSVNGIPFAQTYIDVELADNTYPTGAISDPVDVLNLGDLSDPILIGTKQNSAISFNDGTYHYVRFDIDAITIRTPLQEVTIEITGTVTSVDSSLASEFTAGESVVFTAEVDATAGFDLFAANTSIDATRFNLSPSTLATFEIGGDYTGSNTVGQLDFYDNYSGGFPNTGEGFQWGSNNFTAPAVNGIPFAQTYIDIELADNTYPASAINDPSDALNLGALSDPILIGTKQNSAISFNDGSYHYVRFDVDAITIRTPVQEVTVKISGTVTSVDSALASEFAPGESVLFTAVVGATAGFDLFSTSATVDATRFSLSPSTLATFDIGGDYAGSNTVGQLDFHDNYSGGFPNTAEGFRWESNNFTAPAVNGIPFTQTYIEIELADNTFPASAISDPIDAIDLGALPDPIALGTVQNSAISFYDGTYHYVRFDVDAIDIVTNSSVIDIDGDGVADTNDPCPSDPANNCDSSGSAAEEITSADGGTITTPDGALTLEVEAGDLADDETLSATKIDDVPALDSVLVSIADEFAGQPLTMYVLEPDGTLFANPVELTIDVNVTALSPAERSSLDIYFYNFALDTLEPQSADCVVTENPTGTFTASCTVSLMHFSTWVSIAAKDSDGDGIFDDFGEVMDACPLDALNDTDDDGVCGDVDNCPVTPNAGQSDNDGDTIGDACDDCPLDSANDFDSDGVCGDIDNCPSVENSDQLDTDIDGDGNACDTDDDGDSVLDADDNCPLDSNVDQHDFDNDGFGDVCDGDSDGDGIIDADDQCPQTSQGAIANGLGCSIPQSCPDTDSWKNHGAYVKCVVKTAESFVEESLLSDAEKDAIVAQAAESDIGKKSK